jgi:GGDEF domain-containing protein
VLRFQNKILRMIARGAPLAEITRQLCLEVERLLPDAVCSVLAVDQAGLLHSLAAPTLPDDFNAFVDGLVVGPEVGSCGAAAYRQQPVLIRNIEADPRCARGAQMVLELGLRACWSVPVVGEAGQTIAVAAFYFRKRRGPSDIERSVMACCVELCDVALKHQSGALEAERSAAVDPLTGLANRASFDRALAHLATDVPGEWGLFVVDLDNLKVVNDTFGHRAGDSLIQTAGFRIARAMAPDLCFRLGGDEFGVIVQSRDRLADL